MARAVAIISKEFLILPSKSLPIHYINRVALITFNYLVFKSIKGVKEECLSIELLRGKRNEEKGAQEVLKQEKGIKRGQYLQIFLPKLLLLDERRR